MDGQISPLRHPRASAGFPSAAGNDPGDEVDPITWVARHTSSPV
jgi:DNA polymerase V